MIDLVELFNQYDCSFNSLNESIDTKTSTGRMFLKIIGIFAEFERENIVERVKLGLERKVKEGYTIASKNISFGYKRQKGNKIQEIDSREALIVDKIYNLFLSGYRYTEIACYLNGQSIKTKNGKNWSYKTVKLILTNPNYIGNVRYGLNTDKYFEAEGKHLSIIDSNRYYLVQNIITNRKNYSGILFSKKIRCSCGFFMKVKKNYYFSKNGNRIIYVRYLCDNIHCSFGGISERKVEKEFIGRANIGRWKDFSLEEKCNYVNKHIKEIIIFNKRIKEILYYS